MIGAMGEIKWTMVSTLKRHVSKPYFDTTESLWQWAESLYEIERMRQLII